MTYEQTLVVDDGLQLLPFTECDMQEYANLYGSNLEHLVKAKEALPSDAERTEEIAGWIREDMLAGQTLAYAIQLDGRLVGKTGLELGHRRATVNYWVSQDEQGKGIATRAASAAIRYGFSARNLVAVSFIIRHENFRSQAVAARLGARQVASDMDEFQAWELRRGC